MGGPFSARLFNAVTFCWHEKYSTRICQNRNIFSPELAGVALRILSIQFSSLCARGFVCMFWNIYAKHAARVLSLSVSEKDVPKENEGKIRCIESHTLVFYFPFADRRTRKIGLVEYLLEFLLSPILLFFTVRFSFFFPVVLFCIHFFFSLFFFSLVLSFASDLFHIVLWATLIFLFVLFLLLNGFVNLNGLIVCSRT